MNRLPPALLRHIGEYAVTPAPDKLVSVLRIDVLKNNHFDFKLLPFPSLPPVDFNVPQTFEHQLGIWKKTLRPGSPLYVHICYRSPLYVNIDKEACSLLMVLPYDRWFNRINSYVDVFIYFQNSMYFTIKVSRILEKIRDNAPGLLTDWNNLTTSDAESLDTVPLFNYLFVSVGSRDFTWNAPNHFPPNFMNLRTNLIVQPESAYETNKHIPELSKQLYTKSKGKQKRKSVSKCKRRTSKHLKTG